LFKQSPLPLTDPRDMVPYAHRVVTQINGVVRVIKDTQDHCK